MEENKDQEQPRPIVDQVKEYLETYIKLARYRAIDRGTSIVAGIVTDIFIILGICIIFLFASFTLALFLGEVLHSHWKGFGITAIFYLLVILVVMAFRKQLERPIVNGLIRRLFK